MDIATVEEKVNRYMTALVTRLKQCSGVPGDGFYLTRNTGVFRLEAAPLVTPLNIALTDDDVAYAQDVLSTNEYVFNNWHRISRGGYADDDSEERTPTRSQTQFSDNAIPAERDAFTYDPQADRISNSVDTHTMVGFVSPVGYRDYVLDVTTKSTSDWQNDPIGLLIGYARDPDGTTHTLTVFRSVKPPHAFYISVDAYTWKSIYIKGNNNGLVWATGEPATGEMTIPEGKHTYNVSPWGENPNGIRIRVTRSGDKFTLETSNYNETELVPEATMMLDLGEHPALSRFRGASPYGFVSISQDYAIWEANQKPDGVTSLIDGRSGRVYRYENQGWVSTLENLEDQVTPGRLYYSDYNAKAYYCDLKGVLRQITQSPR